jgi:hypothetical protein
MIPTIPCPRHGDTASILACEHVRAAVSSGAEPPAYRRLRVTVDNANTVAYCACFVCANQFDLASAFSASPDAKVDESELPKTDPVCVKCLEGMQSSPGTDLAAKHRHSPSQAYNATPGAARTLHSPVTPIQVTAAVLLLCVSLGVPLALSWIHWSPGRPLLLGGLFWDAFDAWLIYNIWMGRSWARDTYALIFGLGLLLCLFAGAKIDIPHGLLGLAALYLLFTGPGGDWFEAGSALP